MIGDIGSLSVVGSALLNGNPLSFQQGCGAMSCDVSVSAGGGFLISAGFHEVDAFYAGGGQMLDGADTFVVDLTAPEEATFTIVPEPGTASLLLGGLLMLGALGRGARP